LWDLLIFPYRAMRGRRETRVLSATITENRVTKIGKQGGTAGPTSLTSARSFADWIGYWFSQNCNLAEGESQGENSHVRWTIHQDSELLENGEDSSSDQSDAESGNMASPEVWHKLQHRLSWNYPFIAATRQPAKTSVSLLRRRAAGQLEDEMISA